MMNELLEYQRTHLDKLKDDMLNMLINTPVCVKCPAPVSLSTLECSAPEKVWGGPKANKKEEVPMASYASAQIIADTTERDQREFARDRIRSIRSEKLLDLQKQFGLLDDDAPETAAEFVARIAAGKYTIDKEKMDRKDYSPSRYIRWRDPSVIEDKAGYAAAEKKLDEAYAEAKDTVVLSEISALKDAIDKFKAWSLS